MKSAVVTLLVIGLSGYCFCISLNSMVNYSTSVLKNNVLNNSILNNITAKVDNVNPLIENSTKAVDCLGLGQTFAKPLEAIFQAKPNGTDELDIRFFITTRKGQRDEIVIGEQFGLEWTDFKSERMTVIIVHGFLSHGNETWVRNLESAFLQWGDVNVITVDWSAGGNTWNYLKAAVNTKIAGYQISRLLKQIVDAITKEVARPVWGSLYCVGHSLGAHICGVAANEIRKRQDNWNIQRITGLDPAQPCFKVSDNALKLDKSDAPFIDIIHTNARLWWQLGLGLPNPLGHMDFYPNGGRLQPGCAFQYTKIYDFLKIPTSAINEAICSHGRSYVYLIESLILTASQSHCSFYSRPWNLTYKDAVQILSEPQCHPDLDDDDSCVEMGINADKYPDRGTFFSVTSASSPYCYPNDEDKEEVKKSLLEELGDD